MTSSNPWPPAPPTGYQLKEDFSTEIPRRFREVSHFAVAVAIVSLLYFAWTEFSGVRFSNLSTIVMALIVVGIVTVIHEASHWIVSRWMGCETIVRIEWDGLETAPSVLSYGVFQGRRETILFYLAPVIILTILGIPLVAFGNTLVTTIGVVVLITAWSGSIGDYYNAYFVWSLPKETIEYHREDGDIAYYVPEETGS